MVEGFAGLSGRQKFDGPGELVVGHAHSDIAPYVSDDSRKTHCGKLVHAADLVDVGEGPPVAIPPSDAVRRGLYEPFDRLAHPILRGDDFLGGDPAFHRTSLVPFRHRRIRYDRLAITEWFIQYCGVPRTAAPNRVGEIVDAALAVFGRDGFARAQMADVAAQAGVSVGTLYNYVEGKDALLLLCAAYAFDAEDAIAGARPLAVTSRKKFLANLKSHLDAMAHLPSLDAALKAKAAPVDVAAECAAIVAELFDLIAVRRRGLDALERSARDVPDIAALFYADVRVGLVANLATYIERRAKQKRIPSPLDATVAARFVIESVTWMARHRHGDPDGHAIDSDVARATSIALVTRSICAEAS